MLVIGLTGSIGMGKTTIARQLSSMGAKICNADAIVHKLMAKDGAAVPQIKKEFPSVVKAGEVDRRALGEIVFKSPEKKLLLEAILHPLVVNEENRFVERMQRLGARCVVLDIPLLFETGAEERCDIVLVASAPFFIQKQRVLGRMHMTAEKFNNILASQLPDSEKQAWADMVVKTGLGKAYSYRQLATWMRGLDEA